MTVTIMIFCILIFLVLCTIAARLGEIAQAIKDGKLGTTYFSNTSKLQEPPQGM